MPKPMTLLIEVEEIAFGRVFRKLDEMAGVISINIRGSGVKSKPKGDNVIPFGSKRAGAQHKLTCAMIVLGLLVDHADEPVSRDACMAVLKSAGKAESNITSCMTDLVTRKLASRVGRAEYKVTKKGVDLYEASRSAA